MSILPCNNRGISLVEVVIAIFLTTFGILVLLSMEPMSWKTATKSDLMGKAAEILQRELEDNELFIMNSGNAITLSTTNKTVYASGEAAAQPDDTAFTVQTKITNNGDGSWTVAVTVTGPDNKTVSESVIATRQQAYSS